MITPNQELPVLDIEQQPQMVIPLWVRVSGRLLRPLIRWWRVRKRKEAWEQVSELFEEVNRCQDREELELHFGKPLYILNGKGFGPSEPDTIELYNKNGCRLDFWFKDGKLSSQFASVAITPFDIVAGVLEVSQY